MAKGHLVNYDAVRKRSMYLAARLFLQQGYTATSLRSIAKAGGFSLSAVLRTVGSKEGLLCALVRFVLERQFTTAQDLTQQVGDPVLYYAAETTLQLYMTESDEAIRDLYVAVYSLPECSALIQREVSSRMLGNAFGDYLPGVTARDFLELGIASGGIMQGYMATPCTPEFPIEQKVRRFLECSLRIYQTPEEKIAEAIQFVQRFDFQAIARQTVDALFALLAEES